MPPTLIPHHSATSITLNIRAHLDIDSILILFTVFAALMNDPRKRRRL